MKMRINKINFPGNFIILIKFVFPSCIKTFTMKYNDKKIISDY